MWLLYPLLCGWKDSRRMPVVSLMLHTHLLSLFVFSAHHSGTSRSPNDAHHTGHLSEWGVDHWRQPHLYNRRELLSWATGYIWSSDGCHWCKLTHTQQMWRYVLLHMNCICTTHVLCVYYCLLLLCMLCVYYSYVKARSSVFQYLHTLEEQTDNVDNIRVGSSDCADSKWQKFQIVEM